MPSKGRWRGWGRQCAAGIAAALVLGGCDPDAPPLGVIGHVASYFGGVAADEPRAALVGRDALSAGGSAADAVVAMAFTMMVTRPDIAGPGGGGVCVYYDRETDKAEAIEFLPRPARAAPPDGRWIATVPGGPRGLFALHARYGRLRWGQVVQPAERFARFGVPVSRGLDRAAGARADALTPDVRALLTGQDGRRLTEGDPMRQVALAATLSRIRSHGPGPFYAAGQAREYVEAVREAGGWLDIGDMRAYRPAWRETIAVPVGDHVLHFAPSPALGGRVAAALWRALAGDGRFAAADPDERARLLEEAARRAYDQTLAGPDAELASAGVLAMDNRGGAAACVLTMNRYFGTGRLVAGTGIVAVPPAAGGAPFGLAAAVMANHNVPQPFLAATGAGDGSAPVALAASLLASLRGKTPPADSVAAPHPGAGRAQLMYCPDGILREPSLCRVASDPRGFGYAINASQ